jgi:cathepsin B
MKSIIILGLLTISLCRLVDRVSITKDHLEELKKVAEFEVYDYEEHPFKDLTPYELQMKLGLRGISSDLLESLPRGQVADLPSDFLSSDKWPNCIHSIRDQQSCGSCWAFAASEVLSDRFCIASQEQVNLVLSPQDLVSCDKNDLGCNGGYLDRSWNYLMNTGIVTDECYPYTSGTGVTGTCKVNGGLCVDGKTTSHKYKASTITTYATVQDIKNDIFTNGPVETGFQVYQDFMSYKGGIYKKASNVLLGGHAVKVVGWGVESGTEYWVVANSWGTSWGERGHFRIAIGNCCNFEAGMISGLPNLA